jgi:hypothetical protein
MVPALFVMLILEKYMRLYLLNENLTLTKTCDGCFRRGAMHSEHTQSMILFFKAPRKL